jgi:D-sedoheptulose 7-phosphate isomerase
MRRPTSVSPEVSLQTTLRDYWDEVASVAAEIDLSCLERAAVMLLTCQARGRVVFVVGNGGSAATASHFACDLSKGTRRDGPPTFHVVSLTDNVPLLTAWANDSGYERVFSEQLTALARPGDLLVAISASGNSPNVVAAVDAARSCGMAVVGLSGRSGGRLAHLVDALVTVPSDRIEVVEDAHLIVAHSLCGSGSP